MFFIFSKKEMEDEDEEPLERAEYNITKGRLEAMAEAILKIMKIDGSSTQQGGSKGEGLQDINWGWNQLTTDNNAI